MFIGNLEIFWGSDLPVFLLGFFSMICKNYFYILGMSPLLDITITNTFTRSVACLFTLFMESLDEQ